MNDNVKVAHPAMLTLARRARGITQADVAASMSSLGGGTPVTQGYISRAELGRLAVSGERLELYADALRYPKSLLSMDGETCGVGHGIGLAHHRRRAALGTQTIERIEAQLVLSRLQVRALLSATAGEQSHRFPHFEVDSAETAAHAARAVRRKWRQCAGPIPHLVSVIEKAGSFVLIRDLGTRELDVVSHQAIGEAPLFLLNQQAPTDRLRLSLAHELGHVVMHVEPESRSLQEQQADAFADEYLMPASSIRADLRGEVNIGQMLVLKGKWGVPITALARRALNLGKLTSLSYRNLMVEMSALGYRTQEPSVITPERPLRLSTLVSRLEDELGCPQQVADVVGLRLEEMRRLYPAGLHETTG